MSRALCVPAAVALAAALPPTAHACAVCSVLTDERTRSAIFHATVFLSLLPLAAIGLGLWWLARRAGTAMASEFRESPDAVTEVRAETGRG